MIQACVFLSSGSIVVYLSDNNYWVYLGGNIILSFGQTHLFACPATIADRYFSSSQESFILTTPTFANMLGDGVGLWIPAQIINNTLDINLISKRMKLIRIIGMISCVPTLIQILPFQFTKSRILQKHRSTDSQKPNAIVNKLGFIESIKTQLTNKTSLLNFFMGIYTIGLVWLFISISNTTMANFGYSDQFIGLIGFCYLLFGALCGFVLVKVFGRKIDLGIKVVTFTLLQAWTSFLLLTYNFDQKSDISNNIYFTVCLVIVYFIIGGSLITNFGLFLESCIQICYPIQESVSTGNIMFISQGIGSQLIEILAFLGNLYGNIFFISGILIMFIISVTCYESKSTIVLELKNNQLC